MDTPQSDPNRAATILRLRKLWGSDPGKYWDELRTAKVDTTEVWPEQAQQVMGVEIQKNDLPSGKRK